MQRRVRTIHVRTRRSCTTLEGSCIIDALGADRSERVGARAVRVQRKSPYRRTSRAPRSLGSGGSTAADRADGPGRCACPLTRPASGRVTARARRRAGRPAGQRPGGGVSSASRAGRPSSARSFPTLAEAGLAVEGWPAPRRPPPTAFGDRASPGTDGARAGCAGEMPPPRTPASAAPGPRRRREGWRSASMHP